MFRSETAISRNMNSGGSFLLSKPSSQNTFEHASEEVEFLKGKEFKGSELFLNQSQQQQQENHQSGLVRYRSAPSSFFAALMDSATENSSSGDECEAIFSALLNGPRDLNQKSDNINKVEVGQEALPRQQQSGFGNGQKGYESEGRGAIVGSYSVGMENQVHDGLNDGSSKLVRQSSSPAGFINGFGVIGEVGNYRGHNHAKVSSSARGISNHMSFSSGPSSSSGFMPSIPENFNENTGTHDPEHVQLRSGIGSRGREFEAPFHQDSWNGPPFNNNKRNRDGEVKMFSNFNGLENEKNSPGLVHHLSLPRTAAEMAEVEKYLQFQQDTIPCQIRAKRGCATHPRSIAERMRRTRINEKMMKLQDLFPNLDKQTNKADMLELAVRYIQDLQKQVQTLSDLKSNCVCSNKPEQTSPAS